MVTVGEKLRKAREKRGLTQRQVAELVGVSQPAIQRWEAGDGSPRPKKLRKVAEVYGLRPQDLIPGVA
jgi:transcriptional regulator with XRE-family HTH domain